jgi:hypothetical protein
LARPSCVIGHTKLAGGRPHPTNAMSIAHMLMHSKEVT